MATDPKPTVEVRTTVILHLTGDQRTWLRDGLSSLANMHRNTYEPHGPEKLQFFERIYAEVSRG